MNKILDRHCEIIAMKTCTCKAWPGPHKEGCPAPGAEEQYVQKVTQKFWANPFLLHKNPKKFWADLIPK